MIVATPVVDRGIGARARLIGGITHCGGLVIVLRSSFLLKLLIVPHVDCTRA
jgi:hypothetical protein